MEKQAEKERRGSKRKWLGLLAIALLVSGSAFADTKKTTADKKSPSSTKVVSAPQVKASQLAKLRMSLLDMPLSFEANRGQVDAQVKYLTRAQNFVVFLTPAETVLRGRNGDVLRMKLEGASHSPQLVGENQQRKITNYLVGDRSQWIQGVPNYGAVRYRNVYSGIDAVYHSDQRQLEYDFVVQPGASPDQIRVAFQGATEMHVTAAGDLELKSAAGASVNHRPVVYQTIAGHRKMIDGDFALAGNHTVGFKIGEYDHTQPLVIDPTLQVLSFFGGTLNDEASGVATSAVQSSASIAGVVFVGRSESPTLPPGAVKPSTGINWDAFATGLNAGTAGVPDSGGTTILWTTYFGGSGDDAARGVAMDNQGNVYVTGYTNSSNFGSLSAVNYDAFLVKLNAGSGAMTASTLYGGPLGDQATSIALDYSTFSNLATALSITNPATDPNVVPNVVIGGVTNGGIGTPGSPATTTKTPDGNQKSFNNCSAGGGTAAGCGLTDGFVAIFSSSLSLLHATYIGGGGNDQVNGVAADVWGNIYATGYATPAIAPNFPVVRGIAQTSLRANWDASQGPLGSAVPFVAKWDCRVTITTGNPIGVPSPPFGFVSSAQPAVPAATGTNSVIPICGGNNNLATLANSALFGGSAAGGTFINPQQTAQGAAIGQPICSAGGTTPCVTPITEAGLGIAVDQNGWGSAAVAGIPQSGVTNGIGFPDIVPFGDTAANNAASGGFQPGVAGPHVYVVGMTASRDFATSMTGGRASCTIPPSLTGPTGPPQPLQLCPAPEVWGSAVSTGALPTPVCDNGASVCPPGVTTGDIRIKTVIGGSNSGQTQGWLVAFQFPAVTQEIIQIPGATSPQTVTSLSPPTIPNYIVLQPATCPPGTTTACVTGGTNPGIFTAGTTTPPATPAPPAFFGCIGTPGGISCPGAFLGSWNAVAVDSDMQVYVIGQIGMSGTPNGGGGGGAVFGTGAPNRLALEIERISPYANTPSNFGNFCPGPGNAPCAFPEPLWPAPVFAATSSFVVDVASGSGGAGILNSNFGQILPGAPPSPDPNQPGGLGNGIAVSSLREAFFVGTTTAVTASGAPPAPAAPTATATTTGGGSVLNVIVNTNNCNAGATNCGYTSLPSCSITGGAGTGATCSLGAGGFTLDGSGNLVAPGGGTFPFTCSACITAGGTGYTATPTVTLGVPPTPPVGGGALNFLTTTPTEVSLPPTPPTSGSICTSCGKNGNTGAAGAPTVGPEDVLFGAIQFYDAIAVPSTAINFTANVNDVTSILAPNGTTGGTTGLGAKAIVSYINWEGQPLNIPPGCIILPLVPGVPELPGGEPAFTLTPGIGNSWIITINDPANVVATPGVITSIVTFAKSGTCTGVGQPPLDGWDPITLTISVSAPLNVSSESGPLTVTSGASTGILQPFFGNGQQVAANLPVTTFIDVTTAAARGPMNFTVSVVNAPGLTSLVNLTGVTIGTASTIYATTNPAVAPGTPVRIPVTFNAANIAALPPGTYNIFVVVAASPETPALPIAVSNGLNTCGISSFVPVGSGTTSAACIPITITVTPSVTAGGPTTLVIGTQGGVQQTALSISNPTSSALPFTAGYQAIPIYGTALPASALSFAGTSTTCPSLSVSGLTASGSAPANALCSIPVQVNPAGLPPGVYSGQLLVSYNPSGVATGATPQTTVPIVVYVGTGLGLMLPVNLPPIGIPGQPGQGQLPGTPQPAPYVSPSPGAYPITISVASGFGTGQTANPTIVQVTGLNNTSVIPYSVGVPTFTSNTPGVPSTAVTFTNVGGAAAATCTSTFAQQSNLLTSPLGPTCAWAVNVNATSLNASNTQPLSACGAGNFGIVGSLTFTAAGVPNLVVPVVICVTDVPTLTVAMPTTFPNPTFGPFIPGTNQSGQSLPIAQPSNITTGFSPVLVDMPLPTTTVNVNGVATNAAVVTLQGSAGNSTPVCKVLDIHANGGVVPSISIPNNFAGFLTVSPATSIPPAFAGAIPAIIGGPVLLGPIPGVAGSGLALGPFFNVSTGMYVFQVCANTDPLGNATGNFSTTFYITGSGAGPVPVVVNFNVSAPGAGSGTGAGINLSELAVFRNTTSGPNTGLGQWWFAGPSNTFDATTKGPRWFGLNGDIAVAGDWDGSGVVRIGVFRCPPAGAGVCQWYIDLNNNGMWDGTFGGDAIWNFGLPGDLPVVGDWNGTGVSKIGVMRCPTTGVCTWYLDIGNKHTYDPATVGTYSFGLPGDRPVAGPFAGNQAVDNIGVFRCPASGVCTWYVDSTGQTGLSSVIPLGVAATATYSFGLGPACNAAAPAAPCDQPVVGNWNNTGTKRIGVFRNLTNGLGQWYVDTNGNHVFDPGADQIFNFGLAGDQAVTGFWTLP